MDSGFLVPNDSLGNSSAGESLTAGDKWKEAWKRLGFRQRCGYIAQTLQLHG